MIAVFLKNNLQFKTSTPTMIPCRHITEGVRDYRSLPVLISRGSLQQRNVTSTVWPRQELRTKMDRVTKSYHSSGDCDCLMCTDQRSHWTYNQSPISLHHNKQGICHQVKHYWNRKTFYFLPCNIVKGATLHVGANWQLKTKVNLQLKITEYYYCQTKEKLN